jgi:hypothetical protein
MDLPFCNKYRGSLVHTFRTQANGQCDDESDSRVGEGELLREIGRPFDQPLSFRCDGIVFLGGLVFLETNFDSAQPVQILRSAIRTGHRKLDSI